MDILRFVEFPTVEGLSCFLYTYVNSNCVNPFLSLLTDTLMFEKRSSYLLYIDVLKSKVLQKRKTWLLKVNNMSVSLLTQHIVINIHKQMQEGWFVYMLYTERRVNRGVVFLEHRTFWKESLKNGVKIICENASIMAVCDHLPQDNDRPQFTGRYCGPHHHRTPSLFHVWNQAVDMKCFCRTNSRPVVWNNVNEDSSDQITCSHCSCVQFRWSRHHLSFFITFCDETNGFGIATLP
ncbi:unnamed protein product [Larinioides sclopetarius]|uniref:Uncharacterized protein n=1 Tax=Larinioides sclopetarius TaxID=280406 RepID=A0AAV1ZK31_9ARAC